MIHRLSRIIDLLTPAERSILAFLIGWALLGAVASLLPWTASFSSDGVRTVLIPPDDPRAALHAKSAALAAHLRRARTPLASPLDPNRAPREELDRLPGIGPATAQRWVQIRAAGGPFLALSDLARIRGLGPKRLAKLAPLLRFPAPDLTRSRGRTPPGLNVNRASAMELATLPGVGPVLAERLVQHRFSHGPFRSLQDLDGVKGVGPAMLRKLAGEIRFE